MKEKGFCEKSFNNTPQNIPEYGFSPARISRIKTESYTVKYKSRKTRIRSHFTLSLNSIPSKIRDLEVLRYLSVVT